MFCEMRAFDTFLVAKEALGEKYDDKTSFQYQQEFNQIVKNYYSDREYLLEQQFKYPL